AWLGMHLPHIGPFQVGGLTIDMSITTHVLMLWIAGILLTLLFWFKFRKYDGNPKGFLSGALETIVLFIRDEIAIPNMGKSLGLAMTPFLCTMFFFILTLNLLGLIPIFATATGNINVTAGMAIVTFLLTQLYGIKKNGLGGYLSHLVPSGVPVFLLPIMIPIEIMGLFTKPFALAMRLFANMVAGHTVIYALIGLIIVLGHWAVSFVSIPMAVAINFLELFVAFLQAFIFTMLSALFIGMSAHGGH
ncbi:MAG TPA: F0F1 ATP synthase subunit A, partial [Calditrichia bacterium]|nr:F0F1 ATP synthase subunit A [Calditrichia bacterium]